MVGRVRMFRHVPIGRTIATQRDPACLAGPQMHPRSPDFDAFRAFAHFRLLYGRDCVEMRTAASAHVDL